MEYDSPDESACFDWQCFYSNWFGHLIAPFEYKDLPVPPTRHGFDNLILIPKGLTLSHVIDVGGRQIAIPTIDDVRLLGLVHDRHAEDSYLVRTNGAQEADPPTRGKTARELAKAGVVGLTLLEYLVWYLKYNHDNHENLDTYGASICLGSRDVKGLPITAVGSTEGLILMTCKLDVANERTGYREAILA